MRSGRMNDALRLHGFYIPWMLLNHLIWYLWMDLRLYKWMVECQDWLTSKLHLLFRRTWKREESVIGDAIQWSILQLFRHVHPFWLCNHLINNYPSHVYRRIYINHSTLFSIRGWWGFTELVVDLWYSPLGRMTLVLVLLRLRLMVTKTKQKISINLVPLSLFIVIKVHASPNW